MLDCRALEDWMDENVGGATSWVEFGPRLSPEQQEHFMICDLCRERCLQLLELERQLLNLRAEPLPELDLTAGIMARIGQAAQPLAVAQGFNLWAWTPLALFLVLLLPDPDWLPSWMSWGLVAPVLEFPQVTLPVDFTAASLAALLLWAIASWMWRRPVRA